MLSYIIILYSKIHAVETEKGPRSKAAADFKIFKLEKMICFLFLSVNLALAMASIEPVSI